MSIQKLKSTIENPSLTTLWNRYDEIKENQCKYLLNHLYKYKLTEWFNPITFRDVKRNSTITLSF